MCYCGCPYENFNGGCNKPGNKCCPEIEDEFNEKIEEVIEREKSKRLGSKSS